MLAAADWNNPAARGAAAASMASSPAGPRAFPGPSRVVEGAAEVEENERLPKAQV